MEAEIRSEADKHDTEEALRAEECAHLLHIEATCPHISGDEYPSGAIPVCNQLAQPHTSIIMCTTTWMKSISLLSMINCILGFRNDYTFDTFKLLNFWVEMKVA